MAPLTGKSWEGNDHLLSSLERGYCACGSVVGLRCSNSDGSWLWIEIGSLDLKIVAVESKWLRSQVVIDDRDFFILFATPRKTPSITHCLGMHTLCAILLEYQSLAMPADAVPGTMNMMSSALSYDHTLWM